MEFALKIVETIRMRRMLSKKETGKRLLLGSTKEMADAKSIIGTYLSDHLIIKQTKDISKITFVRYELENDIIWVYAETPLIADKKEISIRNSLIISLYEDQKNIINLKNSNNTKSQICTKSNPDHIFSF